MMGEDDKIVPVINGKILAGLIPHARLETLPGGHLFLVSHPARSMPILQAFLAEPDLAPPKASKAA